MLKGDYFVRQVLLGSFDSSGNIGRAFSLTGIMTFDGAGSYSFNGQIMDSQAGSPQPYSTTGTYSVAVNGFARIQNPIDSGDTEFGAVGVLGPTSVVASDTEGPGVYDDVFVAIPAGSNVSSGSLQGTFNAGFIDFLGGVAGQVRDGYFTLAGTGNGSFGNVSVTGAMANQGSNNVTQMLTGVSYAITDPSGTGTINFPTAANPLDALLSGQKTFFLSSDGNILIGGSIDGFDLMVGLRGLTAAAANSTYYGSYFTAALENTVDSNGASNIDSFYGSTFSLGQGTSIHHQRLVFFNASAIDDTFEGVPYHFEADGVFNDGTFENILGADGQAILQVGMGSFYSLTLGISAGQFSGGAVFLDPLKVWNAASFAPITNSVAPGEFVSLFGTGLASGVHFASSLPLPTSLGNVQVMVNGQLAPLSYVGPNQINILVPYAIAPANTSFATFQVFNNGAASNSVTLYTSKSAPGVFASTFGGNFAPGVGPGAVLHGDFSPVTQSNPAAAGEVLQVYLTGLGSVTPSVADGAAAPAVPLSIVDANVMVFVGGQQAKVDFKGLAPGYAGLYQVNFEVPSGVASGQQVYLAIQTPDAYTSEAKIYIQ